MEKKDINLIRERRKRAVLLAKKTFFTQSLSVIFLLVYLVIAFSLISYNLLLKNELEALKGENRQLEGEIKQFSSLEAQHFFLKDTLGYLSPIMETAGLALVTNKKIVEISPEGVINGEISSDQQGLVEFGGEAIDSFRLRELFENFKKAENLVFVQIEKAGKIVQKEGGSYKFSLKIKFVPRLIKEQSKI